MKKHQTYFIVNVICVILFIAGCSVKNELQESPTQIYTQSIQPSITEITPTWTSLTPISTPLPKESAIQEYLELLRTNRDCHLPCFWGITPGINTSQFTADSIHTLENISLASSYNAEGGYTSLEYFEGEYTLAVNIGFSTFSSNGFIVNGMYITIRELKGYDPYFGHRFDSKPFNEIVFPYSLSGVLYDLGKPASIQIKASNIQNVNQELEYKFLLLYPDNGVLVQYTIPLQIEDKFVIGCPSDAHIDLKLMPAGDSNQFGLLLAGSEWEGFWPLPEKPKGKWLPIDQATDMNIDEFYELFLNNPDACISTPAELWD